MSFSAPELPFDIPPSCAPPVMVDGTPVRCGAAGWADRSLVKDSDWYPKTVRKASERLAHYARRLPLVEVPSTQYFPPTPEIARQWAERSPDGFRIDVLGWNLLSGLAAMPDSLFPDLQDEVRPEARDKRRLYLNALSTDARIECWTRFAHALRPLARAGRLGCIVLRYPPWLRPGKTADAALEEARERLPDLPIAVELRNHRWLEGDQTERTLEQLEDLGLSFVCLDSPENKSWSVPPVVATTHDLAVVRFLGRRADPEDPWPWPYRYTDADLAPWRDKVRELAATASEVHVVFTNCWRDDAVTGAERLLGLLA